MGKNKLKSSKLRVRRCRDKKTEEEKAECREKDRINSSKKRLERTEEECMYLGTKCFKLQNFSIRKYNQP